MITGHWGNQEANKQFSRIKWKRQDNRAKSMSYNESIPKREAHNTKNLKILMCLSFHFAFEWIKSEIIYWKSWKVIQKLSISLADWWLKLICKHLLWMSLACSSKTENNSYYAIHRVKINITQLDYFHLLFTL